MKEFVKEWAQYRALLKVKNELKYKLSVIKRDELLKDIPEASSSFFARSMAFAAFFDAVKEEQPTFVGFMDWLAAEKPILSRELKVKAL